MTNNNRLHEQKGCNVIRKSLEENYNAIVTANYEALTQLLEQVCIGFEVCLLLYCNIFQYYAFAFVINFMVHEMPFASYGWVKQLILEKAPSYPLYLKKAYSVYVTFGLLNFVTLMVITIVMSSSFLD